MKMRVKDTVWAGWIFFVFLLIVSSVAFFWSMPLGLVLLGITVLYFGTNLHEIRSPDAVFLFRMGKYAGILPAGWYLTIPHFWDIAIVPMSWQSIEFEGSMYTSDETEIAKVKVRAQYRVRQDEEHNFLHPELVLRMLPEEMKDYGHQVVESRVRTAVGNRSFKQLVAAQRELEEEILEGIKAEEGEFRKYGYEIRDVEIVDFHEEVRSGAARIRTDGLAHAQVAGAHAKAVAEPLKDNWQAAMVNAVSELAKTAQTIWRR